LIFGFGKYEPSGNQPDQNESNLRSKDNNGSLGAQLFIDILLAMGTAALDIAQVAEVLAAATKHQ